MTTVDIRTGEIMDAPGTDLAALNPTEIDSARDPGAFVVLCLERSKTWLTEALDKGDISGIANTKAWAETIRTATIQKQLGKDSQIAATEIVRRAERALGLAIRQGQEKGKVTTTSDGGPRKDYLRNGTTVHLSPVVRDSNKVSPKEYLTTGTEIAATYAVTDGVTDEQFETALTEAKAEGNLSRANVVRKCKGEPPKPAGRPEHLRKTRHHDANRIVGEIVNGLEGYCMTLGLIDFEQIQPENVTGWRDSLSKSLRSLNRLNRQLEGARQP